MLRKWEQKYMLTTELGVKAVYCWIIKKATEASYDPTIDLTAVLIDRLPSGIENELPGLNILEKFPDGSVLITWPRYDAFTRYSMTLSRHEEQIYRDRRKPFIDPSQRTGSVQLGSQWSQRIVHPADHHTADAQTGGARGEG